MSSADATFPDGFVWGVATSAYQIEGAVRADGRGESIWDVFSHRPGTIADHSTGDLACDSYHRVAEDLRLMQTLGVTGYRFSIAWPRILPTGRGAPNQAGLDSYRRLVAALTEAGIEPLVTLYHWDLPRALQSHGGWANRDTAARFGEYAHIVARALGAEVPCWITINEPWVAAYLGHLYGIHAPGLKDRRTALAAAHHLLLAHGEGVSALRAELPASVQVGIALNLAPVEPLSDANTDAEAASLYDGFLNRWFLDALYHGRYPDDLLALYGDDLPEIRPSDLAQIASPTDLLGINYYAPTTVQWQPDAPLIPARVVSRPGVATTAMGWEISPPGLFEVLERVHTEWHPASIRITENGAAFADQLVDGSIADPQRQRYLHEHLLQVYRAIEAGVPVAGYYLWSLLDNFEWSFGYSRRFGIVHVDHRTQTRTIKESGRWYARVIEEHGIRG